MVESPGEELGDELEAGLHSLPLTGPALTHLQEGEQSSEEHSFPPP